MVLSSPLRPWALFVATLALIWARSAYTPWAEGDQPHLWLHDLLFYLRYVLVFWAIAEALYLAFHWKDPAKRHALLPLACTVLAALAAWLYQHSDAGVRWRVAASHEALATAATAEFSDQRRRTGHFLVDSVRRPCPGQPWLWLGRPHGGGTGINIALVRSDRQAPMTPSGDAYAFWRARDGWWFAYQHAGRDRGMAALRDGTPACSPGRILASRREGLALVADGQRALHARQASRGAGMSPPLE